MLSFKVTSMNSFVKTVVLNSDMAEVQTDPYSYDELWKGRKKILFLL